MIKQISLLAIALCIGACASSGSEAPAPAEADQSAGADAVSSDMPSASPEDVTDESYESAVQASQAAIDASEYEEVVCRKETPTGSRMSRTVCRTRAEIEAREEKDQDSLRRSRASQSGSECTLSGSC